MNTNYQASKWLKLQALVSPGEMDTLVASFGEAATYYVGRVTPPQEPNRIKEAFSKQYFRYVTMLKEGRMPEAGDFRPYFSFALTLSEDHLDCIKIQDSRELLRVKKPVVQVQLHMIGYSRIEEKFRPMILGNNSIHWGVQFSYPQLYFDPQKRDVVNVFIQENFPNTQLFRNIQQWARKNTLPTPFLVGKRRVNVPMRIGKQCFEWINAHPSLKYFGLAVAPLKSKL